MNDSEDHVSALPNVRIEVESDVVEAWIEEDLNEGLEQYVSELKEVDDESYDVEAWTESGSRATINYDLEEYDGGTDLRLEISGGKMAVETVQHGFNELWADSDIGYDR